MTYKCWVYNPKDEAIMIGGVSLLGNMAFVIESDKILPYQDNRPDKHDWSFPVKINSNDVILYIEGCVWRDSGSYDKYWMYNQSEKNIKISGIGIPDGKSFVISFDDTPINIIDGRPCEYDWSFSVYDGNDVIYIEGVHGLDNIPDPLPIEQDKP